MAERNLYTPCDAAISYAKKARPDGNSSVTATFDCGTCVFRRSKTFIGDQTPATNSAITYVTGLQEQRIPACATKPQKPPRRT